jgi:hypothetical protein
MLLWCRCGRRAGGLKSTLLQQHCSCVCMTVGVITELVEGHHA